MTGPAEEVGEGAGEPSGDEQPAAGGSLGYEEARDQLLEVVRTLEQGGTSLEESLALWERGEQLARLCQEWLDGARQRLDEVLATDSEVSAAAARTR